MRPYIIILLTIIVNTSIAQKSTDLNGYVSNLESAIYDKDSENLINENLIHNRLNFEWVPNEKITFHAGLRNRLIWGDRLRIDPTYSKGIAKDHGWMNLTRNVIDEKDFFLNMTLDRFYFKYYLENLEATLGRQRINWGRNLVWNPNDVFNVYSFFDFDYEEKPGADAFRLQYYLNFASSVDIAISANRKGEITSAGLLKVNKFGYDWQILGGIINENDMVAGFGWEGSIKNVGFRGELSYFSPTKNKDSVENKLIASLSFDYMFSNELSIRLETMYSQMSDDEKNKGLVEYMTQELTARNMALSETSLFFQISKPITPLLNASLSTMYFPSLDGYFLNPLLDYSLSDKLNVMLLAQIFDMKVKGKSQSLNMVALRLRYSF